MSHDSAHLLDILNAAKSIQAYVRGLDRQAFESDQMLQDAVLYRFVIIGEAARRLSPSFIDAQSAVPWHEIIGMRNRLTHEYDSVVLQIVWQTIQNDIPALITVLEPLVPPDDFVNGR